MSKIVDRCRVVVEGAGAAWDDAPEWFKHVLKEASDTLVDAGDEIERLQKIERIASVAIAACRAGMEPLIEDGLRSMTFAAASDQFTAAWRDLRKALEAKE